MYPLLRPLLFQLDAETAHTLTLRSLATFARCPRSQWLLPPPPADPVRAFGIDFPNAVGLAAGLDKNGSCIDGLAALGFGFIEVGTVTPRPQPGNPKPRLFRLPEKQAIINRMGFNNVGVDALVRNIERSRWQGVLGINIGRNKSTPNERAADDYLTCLQRVYPLASYVTVNISSPNTQGLRDLQHADALRRLLETLRNAQEQLATEHGRRKPLLVKIAPDLDEPALDAMAEVFLELSIDGVICTNTTIERSTVADQRHAHERGGLSGAPLCARATEVLRGMDGRLDGHIDIIGVGGITSGSDARAKQAAGAKLVQLYSGLIYRGPTLVHECVQALRAPRPALP